MFKRQIFIYPLIEKLLKVVMHFSIHRVLGAKIPSGKYLGSCDLGHGTTFFAALTLTLKVGFLSFSNFSIFKILSRIAIPE